MLSNADAEATYLGCWRGHAARRLRGGGLRYKYRGSSGKVNLALDGLPNFTCLPGPGEHLRGAIGFAASVDELEEAYDDAKYGRFSRRPFIDMMIPTLVDPSMAPPGKHVMSCFVQWAPYHLADGAVWDAAMRDAFGEAVIDVIAEPRPNIRDIILHKQVLTPLDIEETFGLTEGNIFQGELTLEQLFFNRPVPGWARYRTPIREPLAVRVGDPSGRRHHGRAGQDRGDAGAAVGPPDAADGRHEGRDRPLRRGRRRWRPQRPRRRRVSSEGRTHGPDPRAARPGRAGSQRRPRSRPGCGGHSSCTRSGDYARRLFVTWRSSRTAFG